MTRPPFTFSSSATSQSLSSERTHPHVTLRLQTFDYLFAYVYAIPHSQAFFLFLPPSAHRIRRRRFQFWRGSLSRQRSAAAWPGQSCMKRSQSIETASGDPTSRIFFSLLSPHGAASHIANCREWDQPDTGAFLPTVRLLRARGSIVALTPELCDSQSNRPTVLPPGRALSRSRSLFLVDKKKYLI